MIVSGRFYGVLIIALLTMGKLAHSQTLKCPPGQVAETISQGIMGSALRKPFETCVDIYSSDPVFVSPSIPKDTSDEGTIEIKLADPQSGELKDFEEFFYRVAIPPGKYLPLLSQPSKKTREITKLRNDAKDIKIKKIGRVKRTMWANVCTSSYCGWVYANYLRRQSKISSRRIQLVEVAFPTVDIFRRPSVNSQKIKSLISARRVTLKETIKNANDENWIKICGIGWCGWAEQEYFNPVR